MREYSLQDPEYRKTIDLTNYSVHTLRIGECVKDFLQIEFPKILDEPFDGEQSLNGSILDIGSGGEAVIGQIYKDRVIAHCH